MLRSGIRPRGGQRPQRAGINRTSDEQSHPGVGVIESVPGDTQIQGAGRNVVCRCRPARNDEDWSRAAFRPTTRCESASTRVPDLGSRWTEISTPHTTSVLADSIKQKWLLRSKACGDCAPTGTDSVSAKRRPRNKKSFKRRSAPFAITRD